MTQGGEKERTPRGRSDPRRAEGGSEIEGRGTPTQTLDARRDFRWRLRLPATPPLPLLHPHGTTHHSTDEAHRLAALDTAARHKRTLRRARRARYLDRRTVYWWLHVDTRGMCLSVCQVAADIGGCAGAGDCTDTRRRTRRGSLSPPASSIMWNHSTTLILLLTPLIDISARPRSRAGNKCR